jgi:hypothetical protein
MLGSNEAAALLEPFQIDRLRNVVLEPERGDQCDANYEWEAHEVVRIFGRFRKCAERILADQRHQQFLAICHVEAG